MKRVGEAVDMAKFVITSSSPPVLTDEDRAKRMEIIKKAAIDLIIATERAKAKREAAERLEKEKNER